MSSNAQPRFVKESFADALAVAPEGQHSLSLDQILAEGSKSFTAASKLLPARIRGASTAVYAFCRIADDAVDEADDGDGDGALEVLYDRLDRIYDGRPINHLVDRAFHDTITSHQLPKAIPLALFEGFEWDNNGKKYITLEDTMDYCARVASSVGVMMTLLFGERRPDVLARACDLGLAMQLTNICRDVGEDAEKGRIYLPREWLESAGIDPEALLARPTFTPALGEVVKALLEVAENHYRLADIGISRLPKDSRLSVRAARLIYADIGRVICKNGYDSISVRAYTGKWRKLWLCLKALGARFWSERENDAPAHPRVQFLVDAVAESDRLAGRLD